MGRVDDAMKRAQGAPPFRTAFPPDDVDSLAAEPFPLERPIAEPLHPAAEIPLRGPVPAPLDIGVGGTLPPVAATMPEPEPLDISLPQSERPTLFQHIDARLVAKVVVDQNMLPASREQYRRLATKLYEIQGISGLKVVMVSSAVAGEGKSLTASNLALTLSESYRRDVLLIDADLRRPTLHQVFQVAGQPGLSDGLMALDNTGLPLHRLSHHLTVLPAGRPTSDPMAALVSERMRRLIEEAREKFEWVIIDTPPVGLLSDANLLAAMADGVVLVVKAEETPHGLVQRAMNALGRERVIGVVLNRAVEAHHANYRDYKNYYTPHHTSADEAK